VKTHAEVVARLQEIQAELTRLRDKQDRTDEDRAAVPELLTEFRALNQTRLDMEHDAALAEVRAAYEAGQVEQGAEQPRRPSGEEESDRTNVRDLGSDHGRERSIVPATARALGGSRRFRNPWDLTEVRTFGRDGSEVSGELRARAYDAIELMPHASDKVREASARFIEGEDEDSSKIAQMVLVSSSPTYMRAFTKLMKTRNVASLTPEEARSYTRAMSLTDGSGGYLIPFQLDPTVILTADGSRNRIRQISRVVTATGDVWNGISSAGVTGRWAAEASEAGDNAPTLVQPGVPVHKGDVFIPISIEAQQDETNVATEVARMVAFEKDRLESVAFVTGTGSGQPTGIVTALVASSPTVVITSAATDTFAVGDVYALDSALPARYADGATWLAHRAIYNLIRRFDTQGGAGLWTTLGNGLPAQLIDRPNISAEAMDSALNTTVDNYLLAYGDFSNYVIADRIGTTIEFIPHLMGANRRPTGQRGWYAYFRVGADSVNDAAFRLLNVT
jgi:HK97 family phage major capsid protein